MLLKLVDDTDGAREAAQQGGAAFAPTIQPPYRWRDWAARRGGLSGEALKQFVDGASALRPGRLARAGRLCWRRCAIRARRARLRPFAT